MVSIVCFKHKKDRHVDNDKGNEGKERGRKRSGMMRYRKLVWNGQDKGKCFRTVGRHDEGEEEE